MVNSIKLDKVLHIRAFGPGVYEGDSLLLPTDNGQTVVGLRLADVSWLWEVLTEYQLENGTLRRQVSSAHEAEFRPPLPE